MGLIDRTPRAKAPRCTPFTRKLSELDLAKGGKKWETTTSGKFSSRPKNADRPDTK